MYDLPHLVLDCMVHFPLEVPAQQRTPEGVIEVHRGRSHRVADPVGHREVSSLEANLVRCLEGDQEGGPAEVKECCNFGK